MERGVIKVLMVIDSLGPGGKERRFTELARALRYRNEVSFEIVIMDNNIHYEEINSLGVNIRMVIRKNRKDLSVYRKLWNILGDYKPDMVHCWESMTAVYLAPLCRLRGIPLINGMVTNVPVAPLVSNYHWRRAKITFPLSGVIVGNSMAGLRAYGAPAKKSKLIYNGFNFDRLSKIADKNIVREDLEIVTEYVIGMVASFGSPKDYLTYYKAARELLDHRSDITFLALGSGTESEESVRMIDAEFRNKFRLIGKRPDVESYINIMDICVLSSLTEGISNAILEYMALGKPVVASDTGGTSELVEDNNSGFLFPPGDHATLARNLNLLLNDRELREKMGAHGRSRVADHFSIDLMVNRYIDLYKMVMHMN